MKAKALGEYLRQNGAVNSPQSQGPQSQAAESGEECGELAYGQESATEALLKNGHYTYADFDGGTIKDDVDKLGEWFGRKTGLADGGRSQMLQLVRDYVVAPENKQRIFDDPEEAKWFANNMAEPKYRQADKPQIQRKWFANNMGEPKCQQAGKPQIQRKRSAPTEDEQSDEVDVGDEGRKRPNKKAKGSSKSTATEEPATEPAEALEDQSASEALTGDEVNHDASEDTLASEQTHVELVFRSHTPKH